MTTAARENVKRCFLAASAASAVVALCAAAWACGPFFPTRPLVDRQGTALGAPRARYASEAEQLAPKTGSAPRAVAPSEGGEARQTADLDAKELSEALAAAGRADRDELAGRYASFRAALFEAARAGGPHGGGASAPGLAHARVPDGLPAEFEAYARGALAYHRGQLGEADAAWKALLDLPDAQRKHRSTWASFMRGKIAMGSDPTQAQAHFSRVRELARQGFADSLGLASASLGLEAQLMLKQGRLAEAADRYAEQLEGGDRGAAESLRQVARAALSADGASQAAARQSPALRAAVLARLVSVGDEALADPKSPERALMSVWLETTAGEKDVEGADRLAWAAYRAGDDGQARAWLSRAPKATAVGRWVRAKLLLRDGSTAGAAAELARVVRALPRASTPPGVDSWTVPEDEGFDLRTRASSELAVLRLARGQYAEALDLLLAAGYLRDAAHVAERVLTADELKAHVDRVYPEPAPLDEAKQANDPALQLRYVLARRLIREGRLAEARGYLLPSLRPRLDAYQKALSGASRGTADERAEALWEAARIERHEGMELMGTEDGPDWHVNGGSFDEPGYGLSEGQGKAKGKGPKLVSADEQARVKQSAPHPDKRFHYRHRAAKRAVEAARLLPPGSPRASEMLCEARGWVAGRDPAAGKKISAEMRARKLLACK